MDLAIVASRWGQPTETFVRREADAARRAGNRVIAVSLKRPLPTDDRELTVIHLRGRAVLAGVLVSTARHPRRVLGGLARAVSRSRPRNIPATLAAWAIGTACASRIDRVDWIQAHFAWVAATAADALATARAQRFSVFAHAHDIFEEKLADRYTADKLARAAFVLVESPSIAAEVRSRFGREPVVQRMGLPEASVATGTAEPAGRRVVSVGSLVSKKGHDDLIRAVATIQGCDLEIYGEGPQRRELAELVTALGCTDRVRLPGAITPDEVLRRIQGAAVFCLASKPVASGDRDGVPNVLIEAMAQGVPVVSTRVSGIPDLVGEDRGLLVEPGSVAELADALRMTLDDPVAAAERARAALDHVRECYTIERNWSLLECRITQHLAAG